MLPVSSDLLAALRGSHTAVPLARLVTPGAEGADPPGRDLVVLGGSVTLDGTADVRGTLDLEILEPWPTGTNVTTSVLPYGSEIAVWRGVEFGNGDVERAPLGIYRVESVEQADAPGGPLRITGRDRMSGIIAARLTEPIYANATDTVYSVFGALVHEVYPGLTVYWDDTTWTNPIGRTIFEEEDRFKVLDELVAGLGKIMYFKYGGQLTVRTAPDPLLVDWDVDAGAAGVLVSAGRSLTREGIFNAVVARGEGSDDTPPVAVTVADMDPTSPTYWLGPFGKVPRFFTSPFITTVAQAQAAATGLLRTSVGLPYSVGFTSIVNPALEPYDTVRLHYPATPTRSAGNSVESHVLDKVTIPLSVGGALTAETRLQKLTTNLAVV